MTDFREILTSHWRLKSINILTLYQLFQINYNSNLFFLSIPKNDSLS